MYSQVIRETFLWFMIGFLVPWCYQVIQGKPGVEYYLLARVSDLNTYRVSDSRKFVSS